MKTITDRQIQTLLDTLETAERSAEKDETPTGLVARLRAMKEGDEIWTKHYNVLGRARRRVESNPEKVRRGRRLRLRRRVRGRHPRACRARSLVALILFGPHRPV